LKIYRNNNSKPGVLKLRQDLAGVAKNTNGGSTARNLVIETHIAGTAAAWYNNILFIIGKLADSTACIVPSIADSTAHPGTIKVTFAIPAGKTLMYHIVGTNGSYSDYQEADAAMTVDDDEVY
jgi:hypothetical protein